MLVSVESLLAQSGRSIKRFAEKELRCKLNRDQLGAAYARGALDVFEAMRNELKAYAASVARGDRPEPGTVAYVEGASMGIGLLSLGLGLQEMIRWCFWVDGLVRAARARGLSPEDHIMQIAQTWVAD